MPTLAENSQCKGHVTWVYLVLMGWHGTGTEERRETIRDEVREQLKVSNDSGKEAL
jgi:hypothetical protein